MVTAMTIPQATPDNNPESVALEDLLEVELCLREMLSNSSEPAVVNRLRNLHAEICRYINEVKTRAK